HAEFTDDDFQVVLDSVLDCGFNFGDSFFGFFDPGASGSANVDFECAGVHLREKLAPQLCAEHHNNRDQGGDGRGHDKAAELHHLIQHRDVQGNSTLD